MVKYHGPLLITKFQVDLSGLHESVVDSDEEDLAESIGSFTLRDAVRDCLEKDPVDRGEEDVEILMEFTHTLGTVVMNDGEELDSWSVIINGAVRVEGPSRCYTLSLGQGFGIKPTMAKLFHQGVSFSRYDARPQFSSKLF